MFILIFIFHNVAENLYFFMPKSHLNTINGGVTVFQAVHGEISRGDQTKFYSLQITQTLQV